MMYSEWDVMKAVVVVACVGGAGVIALGALYFWL